MSHRVRPIHLSNMDERRRVLQATSKWPEEPVPADYQNPKLLGADPQWDPNTLEGMQRLIWYREALLEGLKKGAQKVTHICGELGPEDSDGLGVLLWKLQVAHCLGEYQFFGVNECLRVDHVVEVDGG